MSDDLLLELIRADGDRWRHLVAKAIAVRIRRAMAGCEQAFEDHTGPIEDCLLDAASAFRALRASRGGRGDEREAEEEAGESLTRLMERLATVRHEALTAARPLQN